jgi:hypothetical protein
MLKLDMITPTRHNSSSSEISWIQYEVTSSLALKSTIAQTVPIIDFVLEEETRSPITPISRFIDSILGC